jgi:hypothetical protein
MDRWYVLAHRVKRKLFQLSNWEQRTAMSGL